MEKGKNKEDKGRTREKKPHWEERQRSSPDLEEEPERIEINQPEPGRNGKKALDKKKIDSKKPSGKRKKAEDVDLVELVHRKNEVLEEMRKKLEETQELLNRKEDRLMRVMAEFENYKKRTHREQDLHKKRMHSSILVELLPVLDDFDRAMETDEDSQGNFYDGIKLIYSRLKDILSRMGLKEIEAEGQVFDPRLHEAMGREHSHDTEPGTVSTVILKGYTLDDMVVRPARVMVAAPQSQEGDQS